MGDKLLQALLGYYLRLMVPVLLVFAGALTWYSLYVGITAFVVVAVVLIAIRKVSKEKRDILKEYIKSVTEEMDDTMRYFVTQNPLPLCMIDNNGAILWFNRKFSEIYRDVEILQTTITNATGLKLEELAEQGKLDLPILVTKNEKTYRVMTASMTKKKNGKQMLYWMDVTSLETLKVLYKDEKVCFAYVNVDNYDELIARSPDERKSVIASQLERAIRQWAAALSAAVVRYRNNQYFLILDQKNFETLERDKFSILDEVRAIETDADFPASLSIGIGLGGKNLIEQDAFSLSALEMALGRGGDQAVVKRKTKFEYYGGKLQTVEKPNKGKSRIMAHALRQMIDQASRVVIMGHRNPDMDCIGASMGVYRIARNRNKEALIVSNSHGADMDLIFTRAQETGAYRFVSSEEALAATDRESLLVVLDAHRPDILECKELLGKTDKVVLIDHHRRAEDCIEQTTLTYMEPYASSTSELVAEILQYISVETNRPIEKLEAEALLAGISVDTRSFTVKTGIRTFDAASWLRRMGADTANVRQFFQTDLESFRLKSDVIAKAEILRDGIALSEYGGIHDDINVLTSQAADDLLDIRNVRASFVVGRSKSGQTVVSARSLGQVNVQTVMEKLGGGGHLTTAGTQLDLPPKEVLDKLRKLIREML